MTIETWLLENGVGLSLALAAVSVLAAIWLGFRVKSADSGNERMREIAQAIQEGAKAYLRRQITTISAIAVLIFFIIGLSRSWWSGTGGIICCTTSGPSC